MLFQGDNDIDPHEDLSPDYCSSSQYCSAATSSAQSHKTSQIPCRKVRLPALMTVDLTNGCN